MMLYAGILIPIFLGDVLTNSTFIRVTTFFTAGIPPCILFFQLFCRPGLSKALSTWLDFERENRTLQERFRAEYHRLPFKVLPNQMIWALISRCTKTRNLFVQGGGCINYYSPYMMLSRRHIDFDKHLKYSFGSYGIARHENSLRRTIRGLGDWTSSTFAHCRNYKAATKFYISQREGSSADLSLHLW